jgi:hypothetical protein
MRPFWRSFFLLAAISMNIAGCQSTSSPIQQTSEPAKTAADLGPTQVHAGVLPPGSSPTPMVCTQNPPNLSLRVTLGEIRKDPVYFQNVLIDGTGFPPSEPVALTVDGHGPSHTFRREAPQFPVEADGSFSDSISLQLDDPVMSWQVFVVHKDGIACGIFITKQ